MPGLKFYLLPSVVQWCHSWYVGFLLIYAILAAGLPTTGIAQGPLGPPGPPAPGMKTLQQVEPRRPVESLPVTISQPGSYYVTTNLTGVAQTNGVLIQSGAVTFDLNGFVLEGTTGAYAGIVVTNTDGPVVICNGMLRNWPAGGIVGGAADSVTIKDLTVSGCGKGAGYHGIQLGDNARVENCEVSDCGLDGINVGDHAIVSGCIAWSNHHGINAGDNSLVEKCVVYGNSYDGVNVGSYSKVLHCMSSSSGQHGIHLSHRSEAQNCVAGNNGGCGIYGSARCRVLACSAIGNASSGIHGDSDCWITDNRSEVNNVGIWVYAGCTVEHNRCNDNTNEGISVFFNYNVVSGNECAGNAIGIGVNGTGNLLVGNRCIQNGSNYYGVVGTTNNYGPIVSVSGEITNLSPWANFEF